MAKPLVLCAATAVVSILGTAFVLLVLLAPDQPSHPAVPFSDFVAEVESGKVDEIRIHKQIYTYRLKSGAVRETRGPVADLTQAQTLRPVSSAEGRPRVIFE